MTNFPEMIVLLSRQERPTPLHLQITLPMPGIAIGLPIGGSLNFNKRGKSIGLDNIDLKTNSNNEDSSLISGIMIMHHVMTHEFLGPTTLPLDYFLFLYFASHVS